jgi:acid phosphatase (class A)
MKKTEKQVVKYDVKPVSELSKYTSSLHGSGRIDLGGTMHSLHPFFGAVIFSILAFFLVAGCQNPQDARTKLGTVPEFHPELGSGALEGYLSPEELPNSLTLIPRPPTPGSAAFAHDEEVAKNTFALQGTSRFELAASDFELKLPIFINHFSCALNAEITKENAPYLYNLLSRSFSNLALSTYAAKNYYKRKRPFQTNGAPIAFPEMQSALEKDPSYPSGHSALGWGTALILAEIAPDRANELIARGLAYTESRIVANHHWYSDVVWGRFMGAATVARLHANPTFLADLETAKAEFAAIRANGTTPTGDCEWAAAALALGFQANEITAIDILLEPDAALLNKAEAINAELIKVYPEGFTLDESHRPHITLIQRFVRTADLEKVYAAANKVLGGIDVASFELEAFVYDFVPMGDLGLTAITAKPTAELKKLQENLIEAVAPYTVESGTSTAFFTTPDDPIIDPVLIHYVSVFVPEHTGEHFVPHLTVGLAPKLYLDKLLKEPFEPFTFSPASAAVYQLGQFGTAAKKLKELEMKL